ncbi:hypothetical protein [Mesorhizobium sp. M0199]|uniref:hypothetical protein n=1 Tax=unclassified Mesorhizobium TaxID=325217 RepID=UPI00333D8873
MREFLQLPFDSSGYGDFGVCYSGSNAKVQFDYKKNGIALVGEIYFTFCLSIFVNGRLDKQSKLPYDKVLISEEGIGYDGTFNSYVFMLSGSDFQFEVVAKSCSFVESVASGIVIER